MVIRPVLRRSNGLSSALESCASSCLRTKRRSRTPFQLSPAHQQQQSRSAHSVPSLGPLSEQYKTEGIPGLFSPDAFNVAWTQYQSHVVDKLNDILAASGDKRLGPSWSTKGILLSSARDPSQAALFNYASMAHNNHFFFSTLSPDPKKPVADFVTHIDRTFSSLETLKKELLTTAAAMFGPGFVWLVQHRNPSPAHRAVPTAFSELAASRSIHLRILVTYLAGSPYPGAHNRQQGQDMNVQNIMSTAEEYDRLQYPQNSVGSFGPYGGLSTPQYRGANGKINSGAAGMDSLGYETGTTTPQGAQNEKPRFGGADVVPLLCVNTWQHCYLNDFGVSGKQEYLEKWWDAIDWEAVWANTSRPSGFMR